MPSARRHHPQSSPSERVSYEHDGDEALARRFKSALVQAPYFSVGRTWEDYIPAYRLGERGQRRYPGLRFEDMEHQLKSDWDAMRDHSRLGWVEARGAVEDAWNRSATRRRIDAAVGDAGPTGYERN